MGRISHCCGPQASETASVSLPRELDGLTCAGQTHTSELDDGLFPSYIVRKIRSTGWVETGQPHQFDALDSAPWQSAGTRTDMMCPYDSIPLHVKRDEVTTSDQPLAKRRKTA
jgi:hypothetical protein